MKKIKLVVKTISKNYPIIIGSNIIKNISSIIQSNNIKFNKCLIVADKKVPKKNLSILKNKISCKTKSIHLFNPSEKNKNQESVNKILDKLLVNNFNRGDCIISFGGGITGDVTGFAASIFKRGIKFINIPTTLLSQVDSSIGGKTGVNSEYGKNLIGSFYQPEMVISDTSALNSLPKREVICGYAEILKHALILDKKLFFWLQKNGKKILNLSNKIVIQKAIYQSCKIKAKIVEKDEKEKDLRMILNFGHTFGHAFEATTNFSNKINHGESVLLGMLCAIEFASRNKILKNKDLNLIKEHYSTLSLTNKLNDYFTKKDVKKIIQFMKSDKKNFDSKIKLILISKIGKTLKSRSLEDFVLKNYLNSKLF
mgnify:CR=1 FL=1